MPKYPSKYVIKEVGKRLQEGRIAQELNIEDVAAMTGLTRGTIEAVEAGNDSHHSTIIEYSFALGLHLKELYDFVMNTKPRYSLPATRLEKTRITFRIRKLLSSDFFKAPQSSTSVSTEINDLYNISTKPKDTYNILKRLANEGHLQMTKEGRQTFFQLTKKKRRI